MTGMITRITRILLLVQAAVAIALATLAAKAWQIDNPLAAGACGFLAVVLVRLLIVANNFFLARLYRGQGPAACAWIWRAVWHMFLTEFRASMGSSSLDHGIPRLRQARRGAGARLASTADPRLWLQQRLLACHEPRLAPRRHHALCGRPGTGFRRYRRLPPIVQRAVETMLRDTGRQKIIILAHSMGGLVARAYLRTHGSAHIARVITLGTPHRGTGLANFGAGLNSEQMRWRGSAAKGRASEWLRQLEQEESLETRALFVSIYSHHDNIISPPASSCLKGAVNIGFAGIGHVALALDPRVQARVVEEILKTPAPSTLAPVELF